MPTSSRARRRRTLGVAAALIVVGAGLVAAGVGGSSLLTYRVGAVILAVGVGLLIAWSIRGRAVLRAVSAVVVAAVVLAAALFAPRMIYGDPDGPSAWQVEGNGYSQMLKLDDSVLAQGSDGVRSLDLRSGRTRYTIPTGADTIWAAVDGAIVGVEGGTVTYFGDDGRKRWSTDVDPSRVNGIAAIDDDRVVAVTCTGGQCQLVGLGTTGKVVWRHTGTVNPSAPWLQQRRDPDDSATTPVHYVAPQAVASADRSTTAYDVRGQVIGRYRGSLFAQHGAITVTRDGCTLRGWQGAAQRWQVPIPCTTPATAHLISADHVYIATSYTKALAVRLSDGRSHTFDDLRLTPAAADDDQRVGIGGDEVIVERRARHLIGRDATTGEQLWTFDVPGRGTPGVSVDNGAVTIYGRPDERRAALTGHGDATFEVTVLDARSGRRTGGLLSARTVIDSYGVAPGVSIVVSSDTRAIGSRPSV